MYQNAVMLHSILSFQVLNPLPDFWTICVQNPNYDLQLAEVVYPITNGYMHCWITNLQSEISDTYHFKWQNGSTGETVYSTSRGTATIHVKNSHKTVFSILCDYKAKME